MHKASVWSTKVWKGSIRYSLMLCKGDQHHLGNSYYFCTFTAHVEEALRGMLQTHLCPCCLICKMSCAEWQIHRLWAVMPRKRQLALLLVLQGLLALDSTWAYASKKDRFQVGLPCLADYWTTCTLVNMLRLVYTSFFITTPLETFVT